MQTINILLLSVGTRNKIVEYFKKALTGKGKVVAADCSILAPALYTADSFYIIPRLKEEGYIKSIMEICRKEAIAGVMSLIDPELSVLAKQEKEFEEIGVKVIGSPYPLCELALDKWEMYRWLKAHRYSCAETYLNSTAFKDAFLKGEVQFPVFIKPRRGSASLYISCVNSIKMLEALLSEKEEMIIQEYLKGQEIGVDCYIDLVSGKVISVFFKKKLAMRAGETDKAVSFWDVKLYQLIEAFVLEMGYRGVVDIDLFEIGGKYYISEVNPRFGGGYPHAYECGANFMGFIVKNLEGKKNTPQIGEYKEHMSMMKYNEIQMVKEQME